MANLLPVLCIIFTIRYLDRSTDRQLAWWIFMSMPVRRAGNGMTLCSHIRCWLGKSARLWKRRFTRHDDIRSGTLKLQRWSMLLIMLWPLNAPTMCTRRTCDSDVSRPTCLRVNKCTEIWATEDVNVVSKMSIMSILWQWQRASHRSQDGNLHSTRAEGQRRLQLVRTSRVTHKGVQIRGTTDEERHKFTFG